MFGPICQNFLKCRLQFAILAITLVAIGGYLVFNWDKINLLGKIKIHANYIFILFLLNLAYRYLSSIVSMRLLMAFNIRLKPVEYFGLSITTAFYSYLAPGRVGVVTKIAYLNQKFKMALSHFTSYFIAQSIFLIGSTALGGLLVTSFFSIGNKELVFKIKLLFFFILIPLVILFMIKPQIRDRPNAIVRYLKSSIDGFNALSKNHSLTLQLLLLNLLNLSLLAFINQILFLAIGWQISYYAAFLICVFMSLINYFNLTPANLGVLEFVFAFFSDQFGFGFDLGLVAAGINRAVNIIIVFSLAPIFSYLLSRRLIRFKNSDKLECCSLNGKLS